MVVSEDHVCHDGYVCDCSLLDVTDVVVILCTLCVGRPDLVARSKEMEPKGFEDLFIE